MAEGVGRPQRPRPRGPGWSKQEEPSRVPASATTSPLRDHAASRPARSPAPHPTSSGLAHTPAMLRPDGPSDRAPASALPTSARGTGTRARAPRARRRAPRDRPTPAAPRPDLRRPSTATRRDEPPRRARTRRTRTPRTWNLATTAMRRPTIEPSPRRRPGVSPPARRPPTPRSARHRDTRDPRAARIPGHGSRRSRRSPNRAGSATGTRASAPSSPLSAAARLPQHFDQSIGRHHDVRVHQQRGQDQTDLRAPEFELAAAPRNLQWAQDPERDIRARLAIMRSSHVRPAARPRPLRTLTTMGQPPRAAPRLRGAHQADARWAPLGPWRGTPLRARRSTGLRRDRIPGLRRESTHQQRGVGGCDAREGGGEHRGIGCARRRPGDRTLLDGAGQQCTSGGRQPAHDVTRDVDRHGDHGRQQGPAVPGAGGGVPRGGERRSLHGCRARSPDVPLPVSATTPAPMSAATMSATTATSTVRGLRYDLDGLGITSVVMGAPLGLRAPVGAPIDLAGSGSRADRRSIADAFAARAPEVCGRNVSDGQSLSRMRRSARRSMPRSPRRRPIERASCARLRTSSSPVPPRATSMSAQPRRRRAAHAGAPKAS